MPDIDPNSVEELDLVAQPERERERPNTELTATPPAPVSVEPFIPEREREQTRGDLARGLLLLLSFTVGGVLLFIGMGRLEGSVLAQSIFPSLIALAGTALGFYFGSQSPLNLAGRTPPSAPGAGGPSPGPTVVVQPPPAPPPVEPPAQPAPPAPPAEPPAQPAPPAQPPAGPPDENQPDENPPPNQPPPEGQ